MKLGIKKKDLILVLVVVILAVAAYFWHSAMKTSGNEQVVVRIDGVETGSYDLNQDQEIPLNNGTNILVIKDGMADMLEADCPDKLCVDQRAISKNHESIICLPNKVVVEVISSDESQIDSMTN